MLENLNVIKLRVKKLLATVSKIDVVAIFINLLINYKNFNENEHN